MVEQTSRVIGEEIGLTDEDFAVLSNLGETAFRAARLEGADIEAYGTTADERVMRRLQQWRGSSLQRGFPIAKQLAGWDFSTRVTP